MLLNKIKTLSIRKERTDIANQEVFAVEDITFIKLKIDDYKIKLIPTIFNKGQSKFKDLLTDKVYDNASCYKCIEKLLEDYELQLPKEQIAQLKYNKLKDEIQDLAYDYTKIIKNMENDQSYKSEKYYIGGYFKKVKEYLDNLSTFITMDKGQEHIITKNNLNKFIVKCEEVYFEASQKIEQHTKQKTIKEMIDYSREF